MTANLNYKAFLQRPIEGDWPYLWIDATYVKVRQNGRIVAIRYSLARWPALCRFTTDGRLEMTNNAAERAIRPLALGRKNWLFTGSDNGGRRAATIYTRIHRD